MKLFLSYANEDFLVVKRIAELLTDNGCDVWIDKRKLQAGQPWEREIRAGLLAADRFIACLSKQSTTKISFVRYEFDFALRKDKKLNPDQIFLIPLLLDIPSIPSEFAHRQAVKWSTSTGVIDLLQAVNSGITVIPEFKDLVTHLDKGSSEERYRVVLQIAASKHPLCLPILRERFYQENDLLYKKRDPFHRESDLLVQYWIAYSIGSLLTEKAHNVLLEFEQYIGSRPQTIETRHVMSGIAKGLQFFHEQSRSQL